jgi:hypothetical protein
MAGGDYYDTLGISKTANETEIKKGANLDACRGVSPACTLLNPEYLASFF